MTAIRTSPMPPATLSVPALAPELDHGLTITRPSPATSSTRKRVNAAEATPPARIAPHDTADLLDSSGMIPVWMATTSDIDVSPLACPGDMLSRREIAMVQLVPRSDAVAEAGLRQYPPRCA